jgi:hypothetical protein
MHSNSGTSGSNCTNGNSGSNGNTCTSGNNGNNGNSGAIEVDPTVDVGIKAIENDIDIVEVEAVTERTEYGGDDAGAELKRRKVKVVKKSAGAGMFASCSVGQNGRSLPSIASVSVSNSRTALRDGKGKRK